MTHALLYFLYSIKFLVSVHVFSGKIFPSYSLRLRGPGQGISVKNHIFVHIVHGLVPIIVVRLDELDYLQGDGDQVVVEDEEGDDLLPVPIVDVLDSRDVELVDTRQNDIQLLHYSIIQSQCLIIIYL